jgi:hypothetical protein
VKEPLRQFAVHPLHEVFFLLTGQQFTLNLVDAE